MRHSICGISRLLADSQHHKLFQFFLHWWMGLRFPKPMIRANSRTGYSSHMRTLTVGQSALRSALYRTRAHPSPSHRPAAQAISAAVVSRLFICLRLSKRSSERRACKRRSDCSPQEITDQPPAQPQDLSARTWCGSRCFSALPAELQEPKLLVGLEPTTSPLAVDNRRSSGPMPSNLTTCAGVAQMARAARCQRAGREFDPRRPLTLPLGLD